MYDPNVATELRKIRVELEHKNELLETQNQILQEISSRIDFLGNLVR